jgi:hypothetical protein
VRHHHLAHAGHALDRRPLLPVGVFGRGQQADGQEVVSRQHVARERLVALLEDVQRQQRVREEHDVGQREHGEPPQRLAKAAVDAGDLRG